MLEFSPAFSELKLASHWLFPELPEKKTSWPIVDAHTRIILSDSERQYSLQETTRFSSWKWPQKNIHFISDIHADAGALISSLVFSGTIKKTGRNTTDFIVTPKGKNSRIVIGGDCLDKGPSNLHLLRTLHALIQVKKNTIILAGNHDLRLYMGLSSMLQKHNPGAKHFFVRMGKKVIPLLKEVYNEYLIGSQEALNPPSEEQCRKRLFPSKQWHKTFKKSTRNTLHADVMQREVNNIQKKWEHFESLCYQQGLSLSMAYLAAKKCQALFLQPEGEFYWFFNKMQLIYRDKSFLFTHAGLDDEIAAIIQQAGIKKVNRIYKKLIRNDLCHFYYGVFANMLRTKYRQYDPVLTQKGVKRLHRMGIHAIVHGHVSQTDGQSISLRSGLLHFECDITLDKNSRTRAGLSGYGAGVTTITPKGIVKGISTDAPYIKIFQPE